MIVFTSRVLKSVERGLYHVEAYVYSLSSRVARKIKARIAEMHRAKAKAWEDLDKKEILIHLEAQERVSRARKMTELEQEQLTKSIAKLEAEING